MEKIKKAQSKPRLFELVPFDVYDLAPLGKNTIEHRRIEIKKLERSGSFTLYSAPPKSGRKK